MRNVNWEQIVLGVLIGVDLFYLFFLFTTGGFLEMTIPFLILLYVGSKFFKS